MTKKEPPIYQAGMQIESNGPKWLVSSSIGTLGCFARHKPSDKPVLLTCSHVMFPGYRAMPSYAIYQPDYNSCCSSGDRIATPFYDKNKPARNVAAPNAREDLYEGYKDGKWYGGFNQTLGESWFLELGTWMKTKSISFCSKTDCAIAMLDPGIRFNNVYTSQSGETIKITGVNTEPITVLGPSAGLPPAYGEYVRVLSKRGLIYGTMLSRITAEGALDSVRRPDRHGVEHTVTPIFDAGFPVVDAVQVGTKTLINQFIILPRPTPPKPKPGQTDDEYRKSFDYTKLYTPNQVVDFDFGDSGSIVIDSQGRVVALLALKMGFVADTMALRNDRDLIELKSISWVAVANPIGEVLDLLNIEIPEGGFSGTAPSAGTVTPILVAGFSESAELAAHRLALQRLRDGLRVSRPGKLLLGKIAQHRQEVYHLLTTVRAISTTWRNLNGPRFYYHCLQSARDPAHAIPASINGITRAQLVEGLLPLLYSHASPALRRDIERYGAWAREALLHISTLDEVPAAIARRRSPQ